MPIVQSKLPMRVAVGDMKRKTFGLKKLTAAKPIRIIVWAEP